LRNTAGCIYSLLAYHAVHICSVACKVTCRSADHEADLGVIVGGHLYPDHFDWRLHHHFVTHIVIYDHAMRVQARVEYEGTAGRPPENSLFACMSSRKIFKPTLDGHASFRAASGLHTTAIRDAGCRLTGVYVTLCVGLHVPALKDRQSRIRCFINTINAFCCSWPRLGSRA
jgi:hypothetical protein